MIAQKANIPFSKPQRSKGNLEAMALALQNNAAGNGKFTKLCQAKLEKMICAKYSLLTQSCTSSLELAMLLLDLRENDEVIVPSYTFVSTANAIALRGAKPVFVDIRIDTLNLDEKLIQQSITKNTRAIIPVHYAGVACEMETIMNIAYDNKIEVIEDAAQGFLAKYKNHYLGTIGKYGAISFHDTKNISCGEGGLFITKKLSDYNAAEIVWEKGTNRSMFVKGEVDKYTWKTIGSSFLPSEVTSALLFSQLNDAERVTKKRVSLWNEYAHRLKKLEDKSILSLPTTPLECMHNGHIFYILLKNHITREKLQNFLTHHGISAITHYIPLHNSPAGKKYGRTYSPQPVCESVSKRILRLPIWSEMPIENISYISKKIYEFFNLSS